MSYATSADVAARFSGTLTEAQQGIIPALLDDVELLIQQRIPDLAAQILAGTVSQAVVVKVEAWAVIRHLSNPDGKYQESIDDYSFTRDRTVAAGALYITDAEWDLLSPTAAGSDAFSIIPAGSPGYRTDMDPSTWYPSGNPAWY